jgi:hypothetical protein
VGQADDKADTRAPESIASEMEVTRERLATTIDELVYRASPKTVARREVASLRSHFVDAEGNPRTENILKLAGGILGFVAVVVILRKVTK